MNRSAMRHLLTDWRQPTGSILRVTGTDATGPVLQRRHVGPPIMGSEEQMIEPSKMGAGSLDVWARHANQRTTNMIRQWLAADFVAEPDRLPVIVLGTGPAWGGVAGGIYLAAVGLPSHMATSAYTGITGPPHGDVFPAPFYIVALTWVQGTGIIFPCAPGWRDAGAVAFEKRGHGWHLLLGAPSRQSPVP